MTRYLLDTTGLIDFSKGREPARSQIFRMIESGDEVGVCAVVVAEFYSGLTPEQRAQWEEFIDALRFWGESREAAKQAGAWRYEFARKGTPLTTTDMLVAAVAHQKGAVVVTSNVKDYPMSEVDLLPLDGEALLKERCGPLALAHFVRPAGQIQEVGGNAQGIAESKKAPSPELPMMTLWFSGTSHQPATPVSFSEMVFWLISTLTAGSARRSAGAMGKATAGLPGAPGALAAS